MTKESRIIRKVERLLFNRELESEIRTKTSRTENKIDTEKRDKIGYYLPDITKNIFIRYLDPKIQL